MTFLPLNAVQGSKDQCINQQLLPDLSQHETLNLGVPTHWWTLVDHSNSQSAANGRLNAKLDYSQQTLATKTELPAQTA